jgi:hypothetical protein
MYALLCSIETDVMGNTYIVTLGDWESAYRIQFGQQLSVDTQSVLEMAHPVKN